MNFSAITETLKIPVDPSQAGETSGGNANGDVATFLSEQPEVKSKGPITADEQDKRMQIEGNSEENGDVPIEEPEVKLEDPMIANDQDTRIQIEGNFEENRPGEDDKMSWMTCILLSPVILILLLLYLFFKMLFKFLPIFLHVIFMFFVLLSMFSVYAFLTILLNYTLSVGCAAIDVTSCEQFLLLDTNVLLNGCLAIPFFTFLLIRTIIAFKSLYNNWKDFRNERKKGWTKFEQDEDEFGLHIISVVLILGAIFMLILETFQREFTLIVLAFLAKPVNYTAYDLLISVFGFFIAMFVFAAFLLELSVLGYMRVKMLVNRCEKLRKNRGTEWKIKGKFELKMDIVMEHVLFACDFCIASVFCVLFLCLTMTLIYISCYLLTLFI